MTEYARGGYVGSDQKMPAFIRECEYRIPANVVRERFQELLSRLNADENES